MIHHKDAILSVAVALLLPQASSAIDFKELLKNPRAYHNQHVSVVGVARVKGPSFFLFENPADAKSWDAPAEITRGKSTSPARTLIVAPRRVSPMDENDRYDRSWVRVTGIVDAYSHGRWNYPCTLLLLNVKGLSPPLFKSALILSVFRNDSAESVKMRLFNSRARIYAEFDLGAGELDDVQTQKGTAEVTSTSGTTLAKYRMPELARSSEYFDEENYAFYFQFKDGKINRVSPNAAKNWNWHR
jgi:hypothetical protein